ncbi:hypothetical protein K501DRAFT_333936 [Backusella circina FSU 941]|nr:hypothetical protein K501DRAFT_333936 [Backusella circina FSU 941]
MTESIHDFKSHNINFPNNEKQNIMVQEENLGYFNSFHPSVTTNDRNATTDSSSASSSSNDFLNTLHQERPALPSRLNTSVRFQDTQAEGRPSVYLFIFVNPLSGDCKGQDLILLPIQHFRLRRFPQVQVEIHNILDEKDRNLGLETIQLVEKMAKLKQLPENRLPNMNERVRSRHIHVWSAGGDGTVMSVFELLMGHNIDPDYMFFSCIPFGTGNDFSQVLGWGRTIPHKDILGKRLSHLEQLVTERLHQSDAARLDVWEVELTAHTSGYVKLAGPPTRKDGHDVLEINDSPRQQECPSMTRKMCNYMSIGVQGYVGSGFEKHRSGSRYTNRMVYTSESAKWVFWRRFPPVTYFIDKIVSRNRTVLRCPHPDKKASDTGVPVMTNHPIDFVIQNIPHIWGREVDLWGDAKYGLECVAQRDGPTDANHWQPQLANDGKVEVMVIEDMVSYILKLANIRSHVSRIGQFETPFEIHFREPQKTKKLRWYSRWIENKYKLTNTICIMCDGEFYILKDPKTLKFRRYAQIWTLGKDDGRCYTGRNRIYSSEERKDRNRTAQAAFRDRRSKYTQGLETALSVYENKVKVLEVSEKNLTERAESAEQRCSQLETKVADLQKMVEAMIAAASQTENIPSPTYSLSPTFSSDTISGFMSDATTASFIPDSTSFFHDPATIYPLPTNNTFHCNTIELTGEYYMHS